jgi:hypothetical protein
MIKEYNRDVAHLPPDPANPLPFPKGLRINNALLEDTMFWERDHFKSNEKWATDPPTRRIIETLHEMDRIEEELDILATQALRFVNSHYNNLKKVKIAMRAVTIGSQLGNWLLRYGQKSANALFSMVSNVNLESLRNFKFYSNEMLCKIQGCLLIIPVNQQRHWRRQTWKPDSGMK